MIILVYTQAHTFTENAFEVLFLFPFFDLVARFAASFYFLSISVLFVYLLQAATHLSFAFFRIDNNGHGAIE